MTEPDTYTYPRYLRAKKTVDARALNSRIWMCFLDRLLASPSEEVRVLEVGGGIGATVERLVEALEDRPVRTLKYTFVDLNPENVQTARTTLKNWAETHGYEVEGDHHQHWIGDRLTVSIRFVVEDLFEYMASTPHSFNAVIAQAILDVIEWKPAIKELGRRLQPPGLLYLPIHFDGLTGFEPSLDLDDTVESLYHKSMSSESGDGEDGAKCGRRLLSHFRKMGAGFEAGSSDWIVHPTGDGYPADEAYFLHCILDFIEKELSDHPKLSQDRFDDWLHTRRKQIKDETLIYIAHQLDVLAQPAQFL